MAGSVILQSATSALLATADTKLSGAQAVSRLLIACSVLQLIVVTFWWSVINKRKREDEAQEGYSLALSAEMADDEENEGDASSIIERTVIVKNSRSVEETSRGVWAVRGGIVLILLSWFVFFVNLLRRN